MADFSLVALKDEIVGDPLGLGYKNSAAPTDWKGDQVIADLLNAKDRTVDHADVDTGAIRAATTFDAYDGLTAVETSWFTWLTQNGTITVNADTKLNLAGIGGNSKWAVSDRGVMEPRMVALMQFTGSRAEELWGEGKTVTVSEVGNAFNEI